MDNIVISPYSGNTYLYLSVNNGNSDSSSYTNYYVPVGEWKHYVLTLDASGNYVVYVNGVVQYSGPIHPANYATRSHLYLGKSWWSSDPLLNGAIKDFQFALGIVFTQSEVNTLYNNVCPNGKSVVSYGSLSSSVVSVCGCIVN